MKKTPRITQLWKDSTHGASPRHHAEPSLSERVCEKVEDGDTLSTKVEKYRVHGAHPEISPGRSARGRGEQRFGAAAVPTAPGGQTRRARGLGMGPRGGPFVLEGDGGQESTPRGSLALGGLSSSQHGTQGLGRRRGLLGRGQYHREVPGAQSSCRPFRRT